MWSASGLGDIMGRQGSAEVDASTLEQFTPLQRVVLLANGNLQRLVSSFYNAPVSVHTRYNTRVEDGLYEREVDLVVRNTIFARCTSTVRVTRDDCIHAIEHEGVAIGQLFRHFGILPTFELRGAGSTPLAQAAGSEKDGESDTFTSIKDRFWRQYVLSGEGIECNIHEDLRSDLFEWPFTSSLRDEADHTKPPEAIPSLGDIMAPATTFSSLPPGFTPVQRLLLTANGNVERILSAFYCKPAQIFVVLNSRRGAVYDRQVALMLDGRQLMLAKSTCFVNDEEWIRVAEAEQLPIGALFRRFNVLPTFTLHAAGVVPGGFWRQYQLRASDKLTCQINETFDARCFDASGTSDARGLERVNSHCDQWGSVG